MRRFWCVLVPMIFVGSCTPRTTQIATLPVATKPVATPSPKRVAKLAKTKSSERLTVRAVNFSSDGKLLLVGYRNDLVGTSYKVSGSVQIFKASTGKVVKSWRVAEPIINASFLPGHKLVLTSTNQVQFWDWGKGKLLKSLKSQNPQGTLAASPKGNLVSSGLDVYYLNPLTKRVTVRSGLDTFVVNASISPGESRLVLAAWDVAEGIEAFDTRSGRRLWSAIGDSTGDIVWSPTGGTIAACTTDGIRIFKSTNGRQLKIIKNEYCRKLWFLRNGKELATITDNDELLIYRMPSARLTRRIQLTKDLLHSLSPDGRTVAEVDQYGLSVRFRPLNMYS